MCSACSPTTTTSTGSTCTSSSSPATRWRTPSSSSLTASRRGRRVRAPVRKFLVGDHLITESDGNVDVKHENMLYIPRLVRQRPQRGVETDWRGLHPWTGQGRLPAARVQRAPPSEEEGVDPRPEEPLSLPLREVGEVSCTDSQSS